MAHFYGTMTGVGRAGVSCTGGAKSGITAHIRGWDIGVRTRIVHRDGQDIVLVWKTYGSNGTKPDELIMEFSATETTVHQTSTETIDSGQG